MERFPLNLIREPTAFMNHNPGELYNNVFAFIVHPIEMHIFQVSQCIWDTADMCTHTHSSGRVGYKEI